MIAPGNHDIERFAALCGTLPHCFSTSMGEKQYRLRKNVNKIGPSRSDFVEGGSVTLPYGGAVQLTDKSE
jgi:hypothetical protein